MYPIYKHLALKKLIGKHIAKKIIKTNYSKRVNLVHLFYLFLYTYLYVYSIYELVILTFSFINFKYI